MHKKEFPGVRGVENRSADGFPAPADSLPPRLNLQDRNPRIVAGKNRQLPGAPIELFREIPQADAAERNIFNLCRGKKTSVGDLNNGGRESDAEMPAFVMRSKAPCRSA